MPKVLIVDDTKNIRTLLTTCLEINGYDVISANNGNDAIELFKNDTFDLAFLDIKLPEISGTEVLRRIRSYGINTPVVIMTAFATVKNAVECTKLGAAFYLQKPFTADKVKTVLSEIDGTDEIKLLLQEVRKMITEDKVNNAILLAKKALSINPALGETYYLLGTIYARQGNPALAEKFYETSKTFGFVAKRTRK